MPSRRETAVVMTEFGPFFFAHFPILLRHGGFDVTRIVFSPASAARLDRFLTAGPVRQASALVRDVRRHRAPSCGRCHAFLLRHRRRIAIYDERDFTPVPTHYLCSLGFLRRIPARQLEVSATSSNIHWSLLPRYPGCHPFYWVFRHGERESGVTIHQIDERYDHGDVMIQHRMPIAPHETSADFRARAKRVSRREFARYLRNKSLYDRAARPQASTGSELFRVPGATEHRLDARDGAEEIRARFRASGPGRCWVVTADGPRPVLAVEGVSRRVPPKTEPIRLGDVVVHARAA